MQTETYELRCRRTCQVKMFSSMTAEKVRRLNRLLSSSGSSFHFVPRLAAPKSGVAVHLDGVRLESSVFTAIA